MGDWVGRCGASGSPPAPAATRWAQFPARSASVQARRAGVGLLTIQSLSHFPGVVLGS